MTPVGKRALRDLHYYCKEKCIHSLFLIHHFHVDFSIFIVIVSSDDILIREQVSSTMEENPFPGLKISSSDFLDDLQGRQKCPRCDRSRKFFCYSCYIPVKGTEDNIPRVKVSTYPDG